MSILIKNGTILDMVGDKPTYQNKDILICKNKIEKIQENINEQANQIIDAKDLLIMPRINKYTCT